MEVKSARPSLSSGSNMLPAPRYPLTKTEGLLKLLRVSKVMPLGSCDRVISCGPGSVFQLAGLIWLIFQILFFALGFDRFTGGEIDAGDAVFFGQIVLGDALHVFRRDGFQALNILGKPAVVGEHFGIAQPEGLVGDVLYPVSKQRACLLD